ncbi:MAG: hypothetical protein Q7Q73_18310 [Verrucomicrobiota bacterium JB024]|nr:hypothetical protein [Verrucomicrobiota bacterium JB024]
MITKYFLGLIVLLAFVHTLTAREIQFEWKEKTYTIECITGSTLPDEDKFIDGLACKLFDGEYKIVPEVWDKIRVTFHLDANHPVMLSAILPQRFSISVGGAVPILIVLFSHEGKYYRLMFLWESADQLTLAMFDELKLVDKDGKLVFISAETHDE